MSPNRNSCSSHFWPNRISPNKIKNKALPLIPVGLLSGKLIHIACSGFEPGPQNGAVSSEGVSMVCGSAYTWTHTHKVAEPARTNESLRRIWANQVQRIYPGRHAMPVPRWPYSNTAPAIASNSDQPSDVAGQLTPRDVTTRSNEMNGEVYAKCPQSNTQT